VWSVVAAEDGLRLASLVYHELWEPREAATARCRRTLAALPWGRIPLHDPPNYDCCCGIHAVSTSDRALAYLDSAVDKSPRAVQRVLGTVSLWGRVVESERGWRAAHAYPSCIVVPSRRLQRAAAAALWPYRLSPRDVARELEAYGVPVELTQIGRLRGTTRRPAIR
jgi:hypothetical protein